MFFAQLQALVKHRVVAFTVADVGNDKLRVCIVPEKKNDDEHAALTAPLVVVGTAAELDAELPGAIGSYVESFLPLSAQTERIRAEREQAEKDDKAKAEEERKARAAKNGKKPGSATSTPTTAQGGKPAATAPVKPVIAPMEDLFSAGKSAPASPPTKTDTTVDPADPAPDDGIDGHADPGDHDDEATEPDDESLA